MKSHHNPIEDEILYDVPKRTICRSHVELYQRIKNLNINKTEKDILLKTVKEAYHYGIKMNDKLVEYSGKTWHDDVFDMVDIICWKWEPLPGYRTYFKAEHVNALYSMIRRNTTLPFRFSCITDDPERIRDEVRIIPLWEDLADVKNPNKKLSPSCYRRLKVFSPEIGNQIGKKILSIDLDCVITGNIDSILSRKEDFVCMRGTAKNTYYNGGLWLLKAGTKPQVWDTFDPKTSPSLTRSKGIIGSDQGWISFVLGENEAKFMPEDGVYCYRSDILPNKGELPDNAKIVLFSGKIDPWDTDIEWVREHYAGEIRKAPKHKSTSKIEILPKDKEIPQLNCITFLWGDKPYNADYVNRLFNSIDRHLSHPHKNICFTNKPEGIRQGIEIKPLTTEWMHKNLKKMVQFDPDNGLIGRILSFDLDNIIIGSLDMFAENNSEFVICESFMESRKGKNGGNLMAFDAGYGIKLWQKLNDNYSFFKRKTKGFERFIYDRLIKDIDFWLKGSVLSYKNHIRKGVGDLSKAKVISCHGNPNPHEIKDKLIVDNWK